MNYYSLNNPNTFVDFKEATIRGQAPDRGLYFPKEVPVLPDEFIANLHRFSREEIAFRVIRPYTGDTLPESELERIVDETLNFDGRSFEFPLAKINNRISALELFHGPTLAFKDVGARFMSRCLGYFVKDQSQPVTVLVATSGDTGGAVASGFYDVPGNHVGWYLLPFALGSFLGPLLLGRLFDTIGRRTMIAFTYGISALLLAGVGLLFRLDALGAVGQTGAWMVVFFFASAAASSAYLTVSESFPLEVRALAIAVFYALGTGIGGMASPWLFGSLIGTGDP